MMVTQESHIHEMTISQLSWILEQTKDWDCFRIETFDIPKELGTIPCGLYGPSMGDDPVEEMNVDYHIRGNRKYASRTIDMPNRLVNTITVIAGPTVEGNGCIMYTAFGGPLSPKEPLDPSLSDGQKEESFKFWGQHALTY